MIDDRRRDDERPVAKGDDESATSGASLHDGPRRSRDPAAATRVESERVGRQGKREQPDPQPRDREPGQPAGPIGEGAEREDSDRSAILEMSMEDLKPALEAVLFSIGEPMPVRMLSELFGVSLHDLRQAAEELRDEYVATKRAFRLEDVAGGLQILTLPMFEPWLRRLRQKERESRLSGAAFETLAVIAYKQPITKADLESIRGVQCGPILKTLLDRGLIKVVGRDESLGRPLLYGTSRRFLESFGLQNIRDLPQPEAQPPVAGPSEGPVQN